MTLLNCFVLLSVVETETVNDNSKVWYFQSGRWNLSEWNLGDSILRIVSIFLNRIFIDWLSQPHFIGRFRYNKYSIRKSMVMFRTLSLCPMYRAFQTHCPTVLKRDQTSPPMGVSSKASETMVLTSRLVTRRCLMV